MTSIFDSMKEFIQMNLDEEPKNPLHVGEVMSCWMYMALMDEATIYIQMGLNSTIDDEVRSMLMKSLKQCEAQGHRFKEFMKQEGVHLPRTSEPRPDSDPNSVPLGVKMTDEEIMNGVSMKTVAAVMHCATAASQSIRNDVSLLFTHCMLEKMKYGTELKGVMRNKGWIKVPPYYYPPGMPKER